MPTCNIVVKDVPIRGYLFVIAAALLWGLSGTAAKFLFQRGITPFSLVQIRLTWSTTILFLALLARRPRLLHIQRRDLLYFALLGTVGMALCSLPICLPLARST